MSGTTSAALLTDLYQLTMASGYVDAGLADREAVFHLFYRRHPFKGSYAIAGGIEAAAEYLENWRFERGDLDFLATLRDADEQPLFASKFLDYLEGTRFRCDVSAAPEGSIVFAHEPILRITGPLAQCQLVETPLLNIINFQTLIATKASRVVHAAHGEPILEFGLRRAQGVDGALAASRAAYLGGCAATSNVLAGARYGIPVKGTHAHSWVMSFDTELESFEAYAAAMPGNCVFLVDTFDTIEGVANAIVVGKKLREQGRSMLGVRLDSGDLAHLSIEARKMLDRAGFHDAKVYASNDLDEHVIESLKSQGAQIAVWGVGTKLVTSYDQPALGGVYKLGAIKEDDDRWQFKIKLSEQPIKISNPGILQVRRFLDGGTIDSDVIYCEELGCPEAPSAIAYDDAERRFSPPDGATSKDLLEPFFAGGVRTRALEPLETSRARASTELASLDARSKRLVKPQIVEVGLEEQLHARKLAFIRAARERS